MIELCFHKSYPNDNLFFFNSFKGMGKYSAVSKCTKNRAKYPYKGLWPYLISLNTVKLKANPDLDKERLYLKASAIVATLPSKDPQA